MLLPNFLQKTPVFLDPKRQPYNFLQQECCENHTLTAVGAIGTC